MKSIKVYLGCSLTNSPDSFRKEIVELKKLLQEKYTLLEFFSDPLSIKNQSSEIEYCRQIYEFDKNCVESCDLFVAEISYPSLGEGMELAFAITNNKPILAIAKPDAQVSRMVIGITHPDFKLLRYSSLSEILEAVESKVKSQPSSK
jgi:nucleoside 2-deoxyribosyltransferase